MTKTMAVLATLLFAGWANVEAAAQGCGCGGSGASGGAAGGGKTPPGPGWDSSDGAGAKASTEIVLKYYWKSIDVKPTALKSALEKVKNVKSVELPADSRTAVVQYSGRCDQLGALETAAHNAGVSALVVNHAHVIVGLKPLKGANLKGAADEIALVEGVQGVSTERGNLELHADLERLSMENLRTAAGKFNCVVVVNQSFEFVKYRVVEGALGEFRSAVEAIKGVMSLRDEGHDVLGMWISKAYARPEQFEKIPGVKVEKQ